MEARGTFLPPALAQLVETKAQSQTLERELYDLFARGRRRVTLGIGPGVDLPLLAEEMAGAGLRLTERDLVVATIKAEPEGYTIERAITNFGLYVRQTTNWSSVGQGAEVRDLPPGTVIGLGSTPADAVKLTLPGGPWISAPHVRSARHAALHTPAPAKTNPGFRLPEPPPGSGRETPVTPPTHGPHAPYRTNPGHTGNTERRATPGGAARSVAPPARLPPALTSKEYEPRMRAALLHWRYGMVTFGGDPNAVVHLPDPALAKLRAAILRNVDQPERGYELFVKEPDPDFWVQPAGEALRWLARGATVKLRGPGNVLGFGRWSLELPEPSAVTPRFGPRVSPTREAVAEVLELTSAELDDADVVKARHRELARRFHPDRTKSDPGATSRFVEIQAAFEAWKGR